MILKRTVIAVLITAAFAGCAPTPPTKTENICRIFDQNPEWYDYARKSQKKWGTPIPTLISFVKQESAFVSNAKPAREWFLFIPVGRPSSAKGYAQAQDPVWKEYKQENGGLFKSRTDMKDALDFIGWYNNKTHKRLKISKWDSYNLYLAYHEGHGGYRRGSYKSKKTVMRTATKVDAQAKRYSAQLKECERRFKCRKWYQFWPFCKKNKK
ncbi:MAG: hypothetical protein MJA83_13820 [Gammaproteobacteria bacterium]|nr:hypothetical protein [Gammaproteobacteria bacterium]